MKRALLVTILVAAFGPLACGYVDREVEPYRPPVAVQSAHPELGRELYLRDCAWCHGRDGDGTDVAPSIVSGTNGAASTDFMLSTGRMPIDDPGDPTLRKESLYSRDEIAEVVEFVETLGPEGPDVPEVEPQDGDLALGAELYQEHCAACHASTAIGGALTSSRRQPEVADLGRAGIVAPGLFDATSVEVAEAIRIGPGTMPVFGEETFDEEELNAVVRYVGYLQDPADPGGAPIGRIGPVMEGAVGWFLGIGLLLIVIRLIGTKAGEV